MSFFSKLFNSDLKTAEPEIQFGRYTDSYKSEEKYKKWDGAVESFENEKFISCYTQFFDFITNDSLKNVQYAVHSGKINFSIYQGSKIIRGEANFAKFKAEAKIVKMGKPDLGLMRLLLEENFNLKYTKYTIDAEHCISLVFDTYVEDGSPYKVYQALKELAMEADRKDDILLNRFEGLNPINFTHTRQISSAEKKIKYDFLQLKVTNVIQEIDHGKLNGYLYPGGISFLLLDLLYSIDYLVKPEGSVMDCIQVCHDLYFNDNMTNVQDKNKEIIKKIRSLSKISPEQFDKELYEVNSTFGASMSQGHQRLSEIIEAQMTDYDWYVENNYHAYAQAICGYIVGYSLYSYALPEPTRALLNLYYRISESSFFESLGFNGYIDSNGKINRPKVVTSINEIINTQSNNYSGIKIDTKILDYDNRYNFSKSYLVMIRNMYYPEGKL